ncbi:MAG: carbon monoxide dehydrogenase subunit G [Rhodospirillales bacterium]|nr:carbon monoxide dehydrogenase subunit G [Rhodospirillales bacterium]
MDMTGEQRINASREEVWNALNDPQVLARCIPGCETMEKTSDNEFTATVTLKVGPVKATFVGNVTLSDLDPPNGYTLSGQGQGAGAGFAKGGAEVRLADDGGQTILTYKVNAQVGGKLAQVGSRLIDGTARKLAGQFFAELDDTLSPEDEAAPEEAAAVRAAAAAPQAAEGGLSPLIWGRGALIIAGLIVLYFTT